MSTCSFSDNKYYVTVRAINNIEFGPLGLTVCHAQPYTIDTTPPILYAVNDVTYDEDHFQISCRVNATYVLLFLAYFLFIIHWLF